VKRKKGKESIELSLGFEVLEPLVFYIKILINRQIYLPLLFSMPSFELIMDYLSLLACILKKKMG
jgi:hypothetical protein